MKQTQAILVHTVLAIAVLLSVVQPSPATAQEEAGVQLLWDQKIPMRDGVRLSALVWKPQGMKEPLPAILLLTPYTAQGSTPQALFFARHGYVFVGVDSRGRGNSEGVFRPLQDDGRDGFDVVEWVARQPWCNGKVGMWGGSYQGSTQWATLKHSPPHLSTAIPTASGGVISDIPMYNNVVPSYLLRWMAMVGGRVQNNGLFSDGGFWKQKFTEWVRSGRPFRELDEVVGLPFPSWKEILDHPEVDDYWEAMIPVREDYARITIPVLTVTGHYDADQGGAMMYYREFMQYARPEAKARHYLLLGPWDHRGTLFTAKKVDNVEFGDNSVIDMLKLHLEWYDWAMKGKDFPKFLKDRVTYYIAGSNEWRSAGNLDAMHNATKTLYLSSDSGKAHDAYHSGYLSEAMPGENTPDIYKSDPGDLKAVLEEENESLYYHTAPLKEPLTISGEIVFNAFIAIDQKDSDFSVRLEEVLKDGTTIPLTHAIKRARYNRSLRQAELITPGQINSYRIPMFALFSRQLAKGSRLRLVFSNLNTVEYQRNLNTGGPISQETIKEAKVVRVTLHHDRTYPSHLVAPVLR